MSKTLHDDQMIDPIELEIYDELGRTISNKAQAIYLRLKMKEYLLFYDGRYDTKCDAH